MLSGQQMEVLQEVANIGMGQAGAAIAKVLNQYVDLSIPRVDVLAPEQLINALEKMLGSGSLSAVRQAFHGSARGEAIAVFDEARCNELADLMGYVTGLDHASEVELLLDVSNMLISGCLGGIAGELRAPIAFSPPSLLAEHVPARALLGGGKANWQNAILVEVHFSLRSRSFACNVVFLIPTGELDAFGSALDWYLKAYQ
jgi:chemotaxis protein CheC